MRYLLLILTIILTSDSHGQQKIVFKKGLKREVIKIDRTIGVTLKGQSFKYAKWESICHGSEDCFCLLYTSDAADERSSVDLGGRRIIKKKN